MLNRTFKESLRNHAAEYDRLQSKKPGYVNSGILNEYLGLIDEMEELNNRGESIEEAFNGTFASNKGLRQFLNRAVRKYGIL